MKRLLKRWSELEPDECTYEPAGLHDNQDFYVIDYSKSPMGCFRLYPHLITEEQDHSKLEYALRDAIEARGWGWELFYAKRDAVAIIHRGPPPEVFTQIGKGRNQLPITALLTAYIKALEERK